MKEDLDAMPETPVSSSPPINVVICSNGVFKLLSELNPFKSSGCLWACSKASCY